MHARKCAHTNTHTPKLINMDYNLALCLALFYFLFVNKNGQDFHEKERIQG